MMGGSLENFVDMTNVLWWRDVLIVERMFRRRYMDVDQELDDDTLANPP